MSRHTAWLRRLIGLPLVAALVLAAIASLAVARPATAQVDPGTGAEARKNCPGETALIGSTITCAFVVRNTGDLPAVVTTLTETSPFPGGAPVDISCTVGGAGGTVIDAGDTLQPGVLCAGTFQLTVPNDEALCGTFLTDAVTIALLYGGNLAGLTAGAFATETTAVVCPPSPGGEGCTPGFWKQDQHVDSWVGFAPDDSFEAVFGVDVTLRSGGQGTIEDPTLLDALNATGGGVNALARHAVAALLNASNPDVASDFTAAEVIALVQGAVASGDFETAAQLLAAANEQGCPLS